MSRPKKPPPVMLDENPFLQGIGKPRCPKCKAEDYYIRVGQWQNVATCRKCGHEWGAGMAQPKPDLLYPIVDQGVPVQVPEDDVPDQHFTSSWRNPSKCFDPDY